MRKIITLVIMLLFLGMTISSSTGLYLEQQSIKPMSFGNVLYVGGNGTGNYSKIQDAINDSINGDTVYVYDDSGPFYEYNISIYKSINLVGEDRDTTIINGLGMGKIIIIQDTEKVTISGFTIINGVNGIVVYSNNSVISDNNIRLNKFSSIWLGYSNNTVISGNNLNSTIRLYKSNNSALSNNNINSNNGRSINLWKSNNNAIYSNNINSTNDSGINIGWSNNNTIKGNTITSNNGEGIYLEGSNKNTISGNIISNNDFGIYIDISEYNIIKNNNIQNNDKVGLILISAIYNIIESNNFIGNKIQAFFILSKANIWDENYWDNWIGLKINKPISQIFPKVILGISGWRGLIIISTWIDFDWFPAQEPYDIEV